MKPRVLMWVQTRLGLGHVARALTLCGALAADGFEVALAHGGPPVPALIVPAGVRMIQLPVALAPDLESSQIQDADGRLIDDAWRARRIDALKSAIVEFEPDVVITETFPLGRWIFAFELVPVLDWLHARPDRPRIVASVRDILTRPSKSKKADAMIALAQDRYDAIICHADETIVQLPDSFPETNAVSQKTHYSGYVVNAPKGPTLDRSGIMIVAGGGAVGGKLFQAALDAKRLWTRDTGVWTLVAGPRFDGGALAALKANAPAGIAVVGAVEGLAAQYAGANLVVAQAGYNTVCEALAYGARLTVVPYATGKETEQTIRAKRFSDLGLLTYVEEAELTGAALCSAMARALDAPTPGKQIWFNGGQRTAQILRRALARAMP